MTLTSDPRTVVSQALAAFQSKDRDRTAELIAELVRTRPQLGTTWGPIARMANAIGEATSAIAAMRLHAANAPDDRERQLELANVFESNNRQIEALEEGRRLRDRWPGHPSTHHFIGHVLAQLGRGDEALESLRAALKLYPVAADSWLTLSTLKTFTAGDTEFAALEWAVDKLRTSGDKDLGTLLYAYGKALDDLGEQRRAFDVYREGAAIIGRDHPYNLDENLSLLDETRRMFDRSFPERLHPSSVRTGTPIFVVGLPRSGTTLMEQILVSHSAVREGAEAGVFRHAAMALPNFRPASMLELNEDPRWKGDVWSRIGKAYLHLLDERFGPGDGLLVDKTLTHAKWIGPIAHVLPEARFIWMRRDPGAIAWSCFRTRFARGINWSWSLTDMGRHFHFMDQMHAHWSSVYDDRVLSIRYEDLVADPETWIPRALAHVGLRDEPQTRHSHDVARVVRTASLAQVRKPIYQTSVGGWRAYEAELSPFFDAYRNG